MSHPRHFQYRPVCSASGCQETAVYKIAAAWSNGPRRELKNYGLACPDHCAAQVERAKVNSKGLKLEAGESMGEIRLFRLDPDRRDSELEIAGDSPRLS